jgi:short-subunit dehydrogenase
MTKSIPKGLAVITGASSGIGAVYADRLAARGHPLLLVARRADRLEVLQAEIEKRHDVEVEILVADLEKPADLAKLEALLTAGGVAMLVNNAGAGGLGPTSKTSADQLEKIVRLNVLAVTRLSHAALAGFRAADAGVLVNIGSIIALAPSPSGAAYSGSKAYVMNFTRSLQLEYTQSGVQVQLVMPGPIRTEFFSSQGMSDAVFPDKSFITPQALVDAALAGLDAGEAITTPTLANDGVWQALEQARTDYLGVTTAGRLAERYREAASG